MAAFVILNAVKNLIRNCLRSFAGALDDKLLEGGMRLICALRQSGIYRVGIELHVLNPPFTVSGWSKPHPYESVQLSAARFRPTTTMSDLRIMFVILNAVKNLLYYPNYPNKLR
jgi:hypothetical protein